MKKRVTYLNLFQFRFPVMAIASILHRLSGVFLVLLIPMVIWALEKSLSSPLGFSEISAAVQCKLTLAVVWLALSALFYHCIAGVRHLCMDFHLGDSKQAGRISAYAVIGLSVIFALVLGVSLW